MKHALLIICILGCTLPAATLAQTDTTIKPYVPLAPLPGTSPAGCTGEGCAVSPTVYLGGIYKLLIGLSFTLTFAMILWGGVQYLSTDAISGKSEGREKIENALWGLIIVLTAVLLLQTIDNRLLNFRFIERASPSSPAGSTTP